MQASKVEYRFRFLIHGLIFMLGFWSPWLLLPSLADVPGFTANSTWLVLSTTVSRQGWLTFSAATVVLLVLALVFTGLAAVLRVWGAAYIAPGVVQSGSMHTAGTGVTGMLADGPYRRTRNPLYLGTLLHTVGICILMPPSGALLAVILIWVLQVRLALAEEPFLAARFCAAYTAYKAAVPRFLPAPAPQVPAAGARARWPQALMGEFYFVAAFGVLASLGWSFNADPLRRGLVIALGVWLILRGFSPRPQPDAIATR
jgi:protein-S-isoprenylcysteine O-methyltransferase Ste14